MTLLAQHGYGKADKLNELGDGGHIAGVILSPADEGLDTMRQTVRDMRARGVATLLDPQAYVYTIPDAVARCHEELGIDFGPLSWGSLDASDIQRHAAAVLHANAEVDTDGPILAPSPRQMSFADPWTPFSLQYARAALAQADGRPVLASVLIEEVGLRDWDAIEQWLDVATALDVAGYYLVVGRGSDYPSAWDPTLLSSLARVVYRLAVLNDYDVIVGYADIAGLVSIAAGARAIASGWSYRQRHFVTDRWVPRRGGRAASPRVTATGLLAPLLAIGEGETTSRSRFAERIFPSAALRVRISSDASSWTRAEAQVQHLEVLSALIRDVEGAGQVPQRLDRLAAMLTDAQALQADLRREGVSLAPVHATSLTSLSSAITSARALEGL